MGKTILTAKQLEFLELVQSQPQLTKRFYFTGGTALAEFYLKHRLSEDIDLFCEKEEVNQSLVEAFLLETGIKYKSLLVDSLRDIAANKVHTLFMRARARDYVDLYFLFKAENYSLNELILDAKAKFDWKKMVQFFIDQAKSLKKEIFK